MEIFLSLLLDALILSIWHRIRLPLAIREAPWYINLLDRILFLLALASLFNSLFVGVMWLWAVLDAGVPLTIGGQIYLAVIMIAPFFNVGALILIRKPLLNPRRLGAAIAMVVSVNLPGWPHWIAGGSFLEDSLLFLAPCLVAFSMSVILFAYPPDESKISAHEPDQPERTHKRVRRPAPKQRYIEEPEFLDSIEHPKKS